MRVTRFFLLAGISALLFSACDSNGGPNNGNRGTVGPGTTATYVAFADSTHLNVESINPNGTLTAILGSPYTPGGTQPYILGDTPDGKYIYVVNGGSNSVTQYSIATDGTLKTIQADVQTGATPVSIAIDSQERFAAVADKGDGTVTLYRIDSSTGALTRFASTFSTGNNPVAVTIHNTFVYAVAPTSIAVAQIDTVNLSISVVQGSPFSAGAAGTLAGGSAGVQLYALDTTNNRVQNYTLDISTGEPTIGTSIAAGTQPTAALQVLSGKFLYVANQGSNNISAYSIDPNTGALTAISGSPFTAGTKPTSLAFDPVNNLLLVGNSGSSDISIYAVNTTTGVLQVSGSPIHPGTAVTAMGVAKP